MSEKLDIVPVEEARKILELKKKRRLKKLQESADPVQEVVVELIRKEGMFRQFEMWGDVDAWLEVYKDDWMEAGYVVHARTTPGMQPSQLTVCPTLDVVGSTFIQSIKAARREGQFEQLLNASGFNHHVDAPRFLYEEEE